MVPAAGAGAGGDGGFAPLATGAFSCLQRRRCRSLWGMLSLQYGQESCGWETPRMVLLLAQGQVATAASHPLRPVRWLHVGVAALDTSDLFTTGTSVMGGTRNDNGI